MVEYSCCSPRIQYIPTLLKKGVIKWFLNTYPNWKSSKRIGMIVLKIFQIPLKIWTSDNMDFGTTTDFQIIILSTLEGTSASS